MDKLTKFKNLKAQEDYYVILITKALQDIPPCFTPEALRDKIQDVWLADQQSAPATVYPFPGTHTIARVTREAGYNRRLCYIWERGDL
jgi:hypothetical protein